MALPTPTTLGTAASVLVAAMTLIMAYLGYRSYRNTGNVRLVFVVVAFVTYALKSLFVAYNLQTHATLHDTIELVSALFDVVIVMLLFVPFFLNNGR